jgi:hypothetical protein
MPTKYGVTKDQPGIGTQSIHQRFCRLHEKERKFCKGCMAQDRRLFFIGQSVIRCSTKKSCAHRQVAACLDWQAWTVLDEARELECLTQSQIRSAKIMFVVWIAIMVGVLCLEGVSCSN